MSTEPTKPVETTTHPLPQGQQPPGEYETTEPKRRMPEPPAETKRAPQHEPGYEAKQKAEEAKAKPKDEHSEPPKADPNKPRSHAAARKPEVRRAIVRKPLRKRR